jgi:hypothetical protein
MGAPDAAQAGTPFPATADGAQRFAVKRWTMVWR